MKTENSTRTTRIGRIGADFDPLRFAQSAESACDYNRLNGRCRCPVYNGEGHINNRDRAAAFRPSQLAPRPL